MQLWTYEHTVTLLPALVGMLILAVVLRIALKQKSHAARMLPLQIIAVLLALLEIGKQVVSISRGYDLYHLPFHFCSLFIFVLPVMAFYKGKYQQKVYAVTASLCTSVLLLMLIYPDLIYSQRDIQDFFNDYLCMHTVVFHNLVMLATILIIVLQVHVPQQGERKVVAMFMLCFCIVSAVLANVLETNFNNFYSCNVPPLEAVRLLMQEKLGYGISQTLYVLAVSVLNIFFVQGCYSLYRLLRKLCAWKVRQTA